jgi:peroxiredoxin
VVNLKTAFPSTGLLIGSFAILVLLGCSQVDEAQENGEGVQTSVAKATIGYPAPDFTLLDVDGKSVSLSDNRGRVLLVNFWATWCTPCRVEMPSMETLYRQFSREEFEILSVSSDFEGAAVVKPFMRSYQLTFPALIDNDFEVSNLYQVRSIPATYIIDQEGVITHRYFGAKVWNDEASKEIIRKLIQSG